MKKLVSLAPSSFSVLADAMPAFTVQPVDSTTDKYGNLSLTFKGTDFVPNESSWHFIDPDTGGEWTGPQLREEMTKNRKVTEFTLTASDKKQSLFLTHVPKFMHGWEVYVLLVNDSMGDILIGEVAVFLVEAVWYWCFTHRVKQAVIYSFLCNAISFLIGLLLQLLYQFFM